MPRRKRAKGKKPKRRRRHPYNVEQSLPIRAANYHELQMREHYIDTSEKIRFDTDDLKEFQIKAVEIDLNSPSLSFFKRYPGFLPTVDEKIMSQKFPTFEGPPVRTSRQEYDIGLGLDRLKLFFEQYYFRWLEYMLPDGLTRAALRQAIDKLHEYEWDGEEHLCAFPVPKPLEPCEYPMWFASDFDGDYRQHEPFPHLRIRITHETDGDDRLLRGELLGIMRVMTGRFKQKAFSSHCVIPHGHLWVHNTRASWVSYIEGDDLVIGYSKLYDFRTRDDCSIHLFMRWLFCSAYGITRENQKVLRRNS